MANLAKVYRRQLKAIQELGLGERLFATSDEDQRRKLEKDLQRVLFVLGYSWPLQGSAYTISDLEEITDSDDSSGRPSRSSIELKTSNPEAKLEYLHEILRELLGRPEVAAELSHRAGQRHRGLEKLEGNWKELHRDEFARVALELLAGFCIGPGNTEKRCLYRKLPLKILIIDNALNEILKSNELLPPELGLLFWKKAEFYIPRGGVNDAISVSAWRSQLLDCQEGGDPLRLSCVDICCAENKGGENYRNEFKLGKNADIPLDQIDLVLQDYHLECETAGTSFPRLYFEVMPQALVFLTTGLDVRSLASRGETHLVDRTIPKKWLAALPWYYYLAFEEVLGSMFWEPWLRATPSDVPRRFGDRQTLRSLLGSVRRWISEPEILWHGQALAEMVDHGHQHISDLWRIANEILGARRRSDGQPCFSLEAFTATERVVLSLGIWLHDVGHRGDGYAVDPAAIRDVHGSISEHLLLERPEAFGLEWLLDFQLSVDDGEGNQADGQSRWEQRNRLGQTLHPLRLAGLLCRHHQSSAPLHRDAVARIHLGLKTISPYSRVAVQAEDGQETLNDGEVLEEWTTAEKDLSWLGSDVRTLRDFEADSPDDVNLRKTTCLLRLLDAIHLNRCRTGGPTRRATHRFYRDQRKKWVDRRLAELEVLLHRTQVGSVAYLGARSEYSQLAFYRDLLGAQAVHLWRQGMVDGLEIEVTGDDEIRVCYQLLDSVQMELVDGAHRADGRSRAEVALAGSAEGVLEKLTNNQRDWGNLREFLNRGTDTQAAWWLANFWDDILRSELVGQAYQLDPEGGQTTTLHTTMFLLVQEASVTPDLVFVAKLPDSEEVEVARVSSNWTVVR